MCTYDASPSSFTCILLKGLDVTGLLLSLSSGFSPTYSSSQKKPTVLLLNKLKKRNQVPEITNESLKQFMRLIVRLTNGLWTARPKVTVGNNRDLKQSGRQRQGRLGHISLLWFCSDQSYTGNGIDNFHVKVNRSCSIQGRHMTFSTVSELAKYGKGYYIIL